MPPSKEQIEGLVSVLYVCDQKTRAPGNDPDLHILGLAAWDYVLEQAAKELDAHGAEGQWYAGIVRDMKTNNKLHELARRVDNGRVRDGDYKGDDKG